LAKSCGNLDFGTGDEKDDCNDDNTSKNSCPSPNNPSWEWFTKVLSSSREFVKDHSFQEKNKMTNKEERSNSHKHVIADVFIIFSGADNRQEAP